MKNQRMLATFALLLASASTGCAAEGALVLLQRSAKRLQSHSEALTDNTEFLSQPAVTTTINISQTRGGAAMGVKANEEGDLAAFVSALVFNTMCVIMFVCVFMHFRKNYPMMYNGNVNKKIVPRVPEDTTWGWVRATWATTIPEVADSIGLDNALLLKFDEMSRDLMFKIGLPMLCIMGPLHYVFGGHAAGDDHMSYLSFGNVENDSKLYFVHCLVVWGVVLITTHTVSEAQKEFLELRFKWLRDMAKPQSTTVMVTDIPADYRSDAELKKFFLEMMGPGTVQSAYVAKLTYNLCSMIAQKESLQATLHVTTTKWQNEGSDESKRPKTRWGGEDIMISTKKQIEDLEQKISAERDTINKKALNADGGVTAQNGFVTFTKRSDAEIARQLSYLPDTETMVVSIPPQPRAVLWTDFQVDDTTSSLEKALGYGLTVALYLGYLPIVIWISTLAQKVNMGPLQSFWAGLAPTVGLQFMVAFLPTFLILIFRCCFVLYDDTRAQHKLQNWYFAFQVTFVILVTSIGSNIEDFLQTAFTDPFALPVLFGQTMPFATHFYCNFIVLQCFSHSMNLTRYIQLAKFWGFSKFYDEAAAVEMSEPEDQDYYGIGSRSARHTVNLLIGLIFGTLCPPLNVLVWLQFIYCRVVYGYLIIFAETKKPDLGGHFWVSKLKHIYVGLIIYVALMSGVLYGRTTKTDSISQVPSTVAGLSLVYIFWSYSKFLRYDWEKLPFKELVGLSSQSKVTEGEYTQAELLK